MHSWPAPRSWPLRAGQAADVDVASCGRRAANGGRQQVRRTSHAERSAVRRGTAIPNDRHRRSTSLGRMVERLMVLDGSGPSRQTVLLHDKMPIGIEPSPTDHVFLYLVTSPTRAKNPSKSTPAC